jgi:antitoxin MazE
MTEVVAMSTVLKARIIKIGNSHGVRIPKVWLEQLDLGTEVEMAMESNQIVIRPTYRPRDNWEQQFRDMAAHGDDRLLDETYPTQWETAEWEW